MHSYSRIFLVVGCYLLAACSAPVHAPTAVDGPGPPLGSVRADEPRETGTPNSLRPSIAELLSRGGVVFVLEAGVCSPWTANVEKREQGMVSGALAANFSTDQWQMLYFFDETGQAPFQLRGANGSTADGWISQGCEVTMSQGHPLFELELKVASVLLRYKQRPSHVARLGFGLFSTMEGCSRASSSYCPRVQCPAPASLVSVLQGTPPPPPSPSNCSNGVVEIANAK